jgi:hypothetical protein
MKDLLRFDTVVAICALLMSSVTAGAMVYQTRVLEEQFSATVWPYLAINEFYGEKNLELHVTNEGVGPALIRSAQLVVDGKPMAGWDQRFFKTAFNGRLDPRKSDFVGAMQAESADASTALRAGENLSLFKLQVSRPHVIPQLRKHDITLRFCYCSINEHCWTITASSLSLGTGVPVSVPACNEHYAISAQI